MKIKKFKDIFQRTSDNTLTSKTYIYDNGFGNRYYICSKCDSYKLVPIYKGGFQPPEWKCENCGEMNYAPKWMSPEEYVDYIENKDMLNKAKTYNI